MTTNTRRTLGTLAIAAVLAPLAVHAQLGNSPFEKTLETAKGILNFALGAAIPIATLYFFWGVIKFIRAAGDKDSMDAGKRIMLQGGLGLFLMVGIWTIISYVTTSVGVTGGTVDVTQSPTITIPQVK